MMHGIYLAEILFDHAFSIIRRSALYLQISYLVAGPRAMSCPTT
jgi:hypothetical protein